VSRALPGVIAATLVMGPASEPGFFDVFLCTVSAISLDSVSAKAQP
jgi:hypothetical protein